MISRIGFYPFFESDTLFLECFVWIVFSRLAILRIEGCLNSTLLTVFLESLKAKNFLEDGLAPPSATRPPRECGWMGDGSPGSIC